MKIRRTGAAVAAVAVGALLFTACSSPADDDAPEATETTEAEGTDDTPEYTDPCRVDEGITETADGQIAYSSGSVEWTAYNNYVSNQYSTYNSSIVDRVRSGFMYYGTDGTICQNEEFGSYQVISEDPLRVQYTIADDASWSDGTPVSVADYLLDWATQRYYADGGEGDSLLFDMVSGPTFANEFVTTPYEFEGDASTAKEFIVNYDVINADWALQISSTLPAHIVADQVGVTLDELADAVIEGDYEILEPAAEFWNEGWIATNPGELIDPALIPSSGRYQFAEGGWTAGQFITLEANDNYWGTPAGTRNLIFRFTDDGAQVQALANGDLDVIGPQATVDTLDQLTAIGESVRVQTGDTLTWEHLDYSFLEGSPFADSLELREAFALCVPRQQIIDTLIAPVNENAVVMNAREVFPFQDNYDEVVAAAYDGRYDEVDIEAAQAKFAEAGAEEGLEIRIGYAAPNPRRTDQVSLIKSSCDQVGFTIVDVGNPDFFTDTLPAGDFEVALYAWAGSGQIASGRNIYSSDGAQNQTGYNNPDVDAAWEVLSSTVDESVHLEQVKVIEQLLWDDLFGIPIFAHPGVVGHAADLQGVRQTATQSQAVWNADQWVRAAE